MTETLIARMDGQESTFGLAIRRCIVNLIIFPGGGNPDSPLYSEVYGLLAEQAPRFGYS